ncbi:hypothetical protein A6U86_05340 [Rhizobium sp. AC27/96]|uniref:hypothetical protein n=1 Tax=Rhizobium sp. AC27/96 TaxID=1841653 RepID=UPI00082901CD|nr:hypothetical protein [Rhizobium sp. AC27/96]OCJ12449.1 hypothetical protein A6U86_05340 [Rhizobium sp. AC27/96]
MVDTQLQIKAQMAEVVTSAVANPKVQAELAAVPAIIDALTPVVNAILHSTNNEPWYQSRVTWGSIITVVGLVTSAAGINLGASTQELLVTLGVTLAGPLVTLWGRYWSKKPIGS